MLTATDIHSRFGNVFGLDVYAPLEPLHSDLVESTRYKNHLGNKLVYRYTNPPPSWNIHGKFKKPVRVELNAGSFFAPHRDYFTDINSRWVRLNCFANHSSPEECTYVVNGQIQSFKAGQWMCVNSTLIHYSFCFKDDTVHYIVDIDISDQDTQNWFLSKIEYCNRPIGEEGYK